MRLFSASSHTFDPCISRRVFAADCSQGRPRAPSGIYKFENLKQEKFGSGQTLSDGVVRASSAGAGRSFDRQPTFGRPVRPEVEVQAAIRADSDPGGRASISPRWRTVHARLAGRFFRFFHRTTCQEAVSAARRTVPSRGGDFARHMAMARAT